MVDTADDVLFTKYYHLATNISAPFGLVCSLLTLTILVCIFKSDRNNVNNLPLRAIWLIATSDIINHSTSLIISNLQFTAKTCKHIIILTQFSYTLYTLTNLLIAYILHMNYLRKSPLKLSTEFILWIINIMLSIILSVLLSHFGIIGYICVGNCILIDLKDKEKLLVLIVSFHLIQLLTLVYSACVIVIIKLRLMSKFNRLLDNLNQDTQHDKELTRSVRRTLHSSLLFPLAGIISMPPMIGVTIYSYIWNGKTPYNLVILKHSLQGLCGVFTLMALVLDPNTRLLLANWGDKCGILRFIGCKRSNNNNSSMVVEEAQNYFNVREFNIESITPAINYPIQQIPSTSTSSSNPN